VTFCNKLDFHGVELLALRPTSKLEDNPLSGIRDCLFTTSMFIAVLHAMVTGPHFNVLWQQIFWGKNAEV
jgi:hypothetical protein